MNHLYAIQDSEMCVTLEVMYCVQLHLKALLGGKY
jgi:hypothetical protein